MKIAEKREKQRKNILKASLKIFARCGFENTKIDHIATQAKIGKGVIYNYFRNKVVLYRAVEEETMRHLFYANRFHFDMVHEPLERLTASIVAIFKFFEANPDRYVIYLRSFSDATRPSSKQRLPDSSKLSIFEPKIREYVAKGFFGPKEEEAEDLMLSFLGIINAFLYKWFSSQQTYDFRSKIPFIAKFFQNFISG